MFLTKEKKLFKEISIRGRLAFGTKCIEQYIKENKLSNSWLDLLVETLWDFVISEEWNDRITDLDPFNILDGQINNTFEEYSLSENDFNALRNLYKSLNRDFICLISDTIEIGVNNLYGSVEKFSLVTLEPTLKVYQTAVLVLSKVPVLEKFTVSHFSEDNGWGAPIDKKMFD